VYRRGGQEQEKAKQKNHAEPALKRTKQSEGRRQRKGEGRERTRRQGRLGTYGQHGGKAIPKSLVGPWGEKWRRRGKKGFVMSLRRRAKKNSKALGLASGPGCRRGYEGVLGQQGTTKLNKTITNGIWRRCKKEKDEPIKRMEQHG